MTYLDPDLVDLLTNLLSEKPEERYTLNTIKVMINPLILNLKRHKWVTLNGEFPLPDMHEEALENIYEFTSNEIYKMNNIYN